MNLNKWHYNMGNVFVKVIIILMAINANCALLIFYNVNLIIVEMV